MVSPNNTIPQAQEPEQEPIHELSDKELEALAVRLDVEHAIPQSKVQFKASPPPVPHVAKGVPKLRAVPPSTVKSSAVPPPVPQVQHTETQQVLGELNDILGGFPKTEILDGGNAETLKEAIRSFVTKSGYRASAATDKGVNYKDHNEDCVVVSPETNMIAVVDGMGGREGGREAGQYIARALKENPLNVKSAIEKAKAMMDKNLDMSGACFLSARVMEQKGKKYLDVNQAGDVKLIVYDKNGRVKNQSKDQSLPQILVDLGIIDEDQALYNQYRNVVIGGISTENYLETQREALEGLKDPKKYPKDAIKAFPEPGETKNYIVPVESGDRIVIISDGISDNFTPKEIGGMIEGKTQEEAIQEISDATDERMMDEANIIKTTEAAGGRVELRAFSDGYLSTPKRDNRGIAILDIA